MARRRRLVMQIITEFEEFRRNFPEAILPDYIDRGGFRYPTSFSALDEYLARIAERMRMIRPESAPVLGIGCANPADRTSVNGQSTVNPDSRSGTPSPPAPQMRQYADVAAGASAAPNPPLLNVSGIAQNTPARQEEQQLRSILRNTP